MRLSKCKYDAPARIDLGLPNWGGGNQQVVPSPAPPATRLRRGPARLGIVAAGAAVASEVRLLRSYTPSPPPRPLPPNKMHWQPAEESEIPESLL